MQEWEQESPQTCDQAIIRLSNPTPRPGEQYSPRPDVKGHRPRQHQNEMVETCDCFSFTETSQKASALLGLVLIHKSENEPEKPIGKAEFFWKLNSAKALGEPFPL